MSVPERSAHLAENSPKIIHKSPRKKKMFREIRDGFSAPLGATFLFSAYYPEIFTSLISRKKNWFFKNKK